MNTNQFIKMYTPLVSLFNSSKELYIITSILSYQLNNQQFYKTKKVIAKEIAISDGAVQNIINKLSKQGYIIRETVSNYDGNKGGSKSFLRVNIDKINEELEKRGISETNPIIKQEVIQPTKVVKEEVIQSKEELTIERWEEENMDLIIKYKFLDNEKEYELLKKLRLKYGYDSFDADDYDSELIYNLETQGYLRYNNSTKKYKVTTKYNDVIKEEMIQRGVEVKEEIQEEEYTQAQLEWLNKTKEDDFFNVEEEDEDYGYNPEWEDNKVTADEVLKLIKTTKQY